MGDTMVNIVCGDCGSADTQWASLNKGLFLCNDCSFIHRSLGPQYSRLKSLNHSKWNESLRKMVTTLASGAANNVWEHLLLNPSKSEPQMKKPTPSDSLEVVKKRFITAKHLNFQFVLRQKAETFKERNEELHCTVRTADIGTALRLIASGADPNFFHPERGTRPLHVACRSGQALQVELLFVHGAEIDAPDYLGQTPADHAKAAGFKELAMRIEELRYHLTDQLSRFVCGEVPDHTTAKHIIIPAQPANSFGQDEKIKTLPPYMLEQLASDLYDEVDRRDAEKILLSSTADHARFSIAFLPVNQNFPSVRNQTRQKFARLTDSELSALITSILRESKRRHNGSALLETDKDIFLENDSLTPTSEAPSAALMNGNGPVVNEDDEFPLYDSVASDDDIVMSEVQTIETHTPPANNFNSVSSCAVRNTTTTTDNPFLTKLAEDRIAELETNNLGLKYELKVVRQMLTDYVQDNLERRRFSELDRLNSNTLDPEGRTPGVVLRQHNMPSELYSHLKKFRSVSMYAEKLENEDPIVRGKDDVSTSVQNTTRDIVELIKVLIEYARSGDYQGVQLTANKAYDVAQGMASSMLLCRELDANIRSGLHNVVVKVLRMKTEVPLLSNSQLLRAAAISDGSLNLNNVEPSDLYVQKIKQLCFEVIRKARNGFSSGKTLPISFRLEQLRALLNLVKENRGDLLNALHRDLRKPRTEGIVHELDIVESEATSMIRNLEDYASPEKMPVNILTPMDRGYILKEPYGLVLIVGTWNFPFVVSLSPLVGAIAAGNAVIIKPSEVAPFSANILAHLIPQYLDRDCYHVVLGDVTETEELLQHKFDYIFFTGSPTVGKKVLAAAAPHLTPVTLELGGKNPCYIDESVDIEKATKRIIWGKFLNAGQACISIDYIVCTPTVCEKFLRLAYQLLNEWHGTSPRSCASLARIVNGAHFRRLSNLLDTTHGRIILGGNSNERELWIQPTVVIDVEPGDVLLQEEIFGPILPVVTVSSVEDAIEFMRTKPTPLALYTFSADNSINDKIIRSVPSGGVCINDVILHTNWNLLPFGGCGMAGMGAIHGKFTFDTFTHHRSVLHRGLSYFSEKSLDMRYPPYTAQKTKLQSLFVKHFDKFFVAQSKLYKFLVILAVVTFYLGIRRVVNIPKLRAVLNAVKMTIVRKLR